MKKRILSIVLTVLMLVSVLPTSALAVDAETDAGAGKQPTTSVSADKDAIHVNKSISADGKTLTLEAFATNTVSTETTYEPLDIVLVLDVSGSMDDHMASYTYTKVENKTNWSCEDVYNNGRYGYYYLDANGSYHAVRYDSRGGGLFGGRYRCWVTADGKAIGNTVYNWRDASYTGPLYTRKIEGTEQKMAALQRAVKTFIGNVAAQEDSKGNTIENRISIVKFAGDESNRVGNDFYRDGQNTYNYSQVVKNLLPAKDNEKTLKDAVDALRPAGATQSDNGMKLAASVLGAREMDENSTELPKSVVIMFTDGTPTSWQDFESGVASGAITAAKALKANKTTVFTVGVFEGAAPDADVNSASNENKYMHAVSSNYPSATYENKGFIISDWTWTFGTRAANSNYYLAASNAAQLDDIFQAISKEVNSLTAKVDATSVLSDTLSGAFDFNAPENAEYSGITVAKYPVTGMENGAYTWGAAQELTIGEGKDVQVEVTGKKLEVKGFDYGKNAVTTNEEGDEPVYSGYKLVVTIPIKPDTNYSDWKQGTDYYDTNSTAEGSKAGLSYGENGSQKLELTDSPEAPVTGYKVTYLVTSTENPPYNEVKDDTVYLKGQEPAVKPLPTTTSQEKDGQKGEWSFDGWYNGSTKAGATIEITDNVTLTGEWKFTEAAKYGVTYTYVAATGSPALPDAISTTTGTGDYAVSDAETYYEGATVTRKNPNSDTYTDTVNHGTWKLTWDKASDTMTTSGVTFTGTWTFTAEETYKVTYTILDGEKPFDAADLEPAEVSGLYKGQSYTVVETPTSADVGKDEQPGTWILDGWYFDRDLKNEAITFDIEGNTELFGKWLFMPNMCSVVYHLEGETPEGVTLDTATVTGIEYGTNYTTNQPSENNVSGTKDGKSGTWMFSGWYHSEAYAGEPVMSFDVTLPREDLYGKWTFKADELPPETYRTIDLTIDKTLINHRGVAPGETYEFQVFYKDKNGEAVNIGDRLTLTLAEGDTWDRDKFQIKLPQSVLTDTDNEHFWPEETVKGFDDDDNVIEVKVRYAYVYEIDGSTKGMDYDDAVPFGRLIPNAIANSAHAWSYGDYTLVSYQTEDDIFYFTNEYTKPTDDKEVKPAKVGPQLNRDDHVAYIMGYPDGNVRPEGEITRAEACTIFFRLLTESSRDYYFSKTNDYTDVARSDWFNNAISTLSNAGIVTGYNDGTFRPNQPITRGEMAKIIANFANLNKGTKSFTDLAGHWSKSYVELAAGNGWIAGYPDGSFRPDQKITRAETVTMINRVLERVPAKESRLLSRSIMLTFPDNNPGDWYYIAIQEASNSHEYQRSVYESAGDEMWIRLIDNIDWTKLEK